MPEQDVLNLEGGDLEAAALDEVLDDTEGLGDDWVATKELAERRVEAKLEVERQAELLYGATSTSRGSWTYLRHTEKRRTFCEVEETTASRVMSEIADHWYGDAPEIRNDVLNRHELSSQTAKARRVLVEAMINSADQPSLGIEGSGPDKTLYRTTLKAF